MRKILFFFTAVIFLSTAASAQIEKPVKWSYASKKISDKEAIVLFKATLEKGWHIYSQHQKEGPVPTSIGLSKSADYSPIGTASEPKGVKKYEEVFDTDVTYFENQVVFQQKIKLNKANPVVKGTIEFMVCDDTRCLPPDEIEFSIAVK